MTESERLRELVAINRAIISTLDYDEVLRLVVEKTAAFTGADACALLLAGPENRATVAASIGIEAEKVREFSAPLDERINTALRDLLDFRHDDTFLGVPVIEHGNVRGILAVYRRGAGAPPLDEEILLNALADQAAIALEHAARYEAVERDLRAREVLTERVFARAPLGIYVFGADLAFRDVNATGAHIVGLSHEEIVGRRLDEVLGEAGEGLEPLLRRALRGEEVAVTECPMKCPRHPEWGEVFWDGRAVALPDEEGRAEAVAAVVWDVTDRVRAERERTAHAAELAEANEAKDLFFNILSHELRTPLAAILNGVTLLRHSSVTPEQRTRAYSVIERNTQHQARLVDDLLDLSRIMRGKVRLDQEPLDLREVVAAQVEAQEPEVLRAGLRVALSLPEQPLCVRGDRIRLGQVFANLMTNAVRYTMPDGSITVSAADEEGQAVVRVRDTGIGISPEVLPHLFEPFRQADTSLARTRGGLGIGLAIVHSLVVQHGGAISAESAGPGKGSEFAVRLPLDLEGCRRCAEAPAEATPAARRVLLVEDNRDLRETLAELLEMHGHQVVAAADGRSALAAAHAEKPHLALIDIGLPDIDGYEVARRLRATPGMEGVRLVALTGYAGDDHQRRAMDAGFDAHVVKPVSVPALEREMAAAR